MSTDDTPRPAPMGAVLYPDDGRPEALLTDFARRLQAQGVRVGGVLQQTRSMPGRTKDNMVLVDIQTGQEIPLSQDLGDGSSACSLDLSALAAAAVILQRSVDQGCDVVLVNKFSHQEAVGRGLAQDILAVVLAGIPLLTALRPARRDDWADFTGGHGTILPPDAARLDDWWAQVRPSPAG